ncbi:MAG TPA: dihydropteroate synthase [Candidatus Krumholzibacterium sp.]|nr:dihydropteroate synthase [Candidatus Krumholzibacterium sp.]
MNRYILRTVSSRERDTLCRRLAEAGVTGEGISIMASKAEPVVIRVDRLGAAAANILKQQLLSLGGDAAVHRDVIKGGPELSTGYIIADERRMRALPDRLASQPFGLAEVGTEITRLLDLKAHPPASIPLPDGSIDLSGGPVIMGILNVTPDSFSDGGRYLGPSEACDRAFRMAEQGAGIIDIGGESSRPGAEELAAAEELDRLIPVLEGLRGRLEVPVSVDTRKGAVARAAIAAGASILNDISGFTHDPDMVEAALGSGTAVVVMHMLGTPETMQVDPSYLDPAGEIVDWLGERAGELVAAGIDPRKIIVDPGIGFGKRLQDNLDIIDRAGDLHTLGMPVMMGFSRKSFIGTVTGREPGDRLPGGLAVLGCCLDAGIQLFRVHDVRETRDYIDMWKAIRRKDEAR